MRVDREDRIPEIAAKAKALKVDAGNVAGCDVGPMISPQVTTALLCLIRCSRVLMALWAACCGLPVTPASRRVAWRR